MKANITNHFFRLSKPIALAMFLIISSIVNAQTPTPAAMFKGGQTYWVDGVGADYVLPKDTFVNLTGAHLLDSDFVQTTGLLTAFNNQGVDPTTLGQVTFMLTTGYTGNEGSLINIGRPTGTGGYPFMTSQRPVVIKPAPGTSHSITTTATPMAANSALVRFNGAQYVTIDGEGTAGQRNISFVVPSGTTTVGVRVVEVRTFPTSGCRFLTVKNCRLVGSSTQTAINTYAGIYSGGTSAPSAPALTSQNLTFTNNAIEAVQNGIYIRGLESIANRQDNALIVSNNIIGGTNNGSVTATTYVGGAVNAAGITLIAQKNAIVSGNIVRNNLPTQGGFRGILLTNTGTIALDSGIAITANKIYNLRSTAASTGVYGIRISFAGTHSQPLAITVSNNTIANLLSSNTGSLISGVSNIVGMMVEDLSSNTGMSFYNNSVHLYGDTLNVNALSACFLTSAGVTGGVRVANNIFVNRLGRSLYSTGLSSSSYIYAIGSVTVNPFALISNNAYHVNNTSGSFSFIGVRGTADKSTMKTWAASVNDNSSIANIPPFVNVANDSMCFIGNGAGSILGNYGIPVGVLTDMNGNARSATTPSLGAYEFSGNAAIANYTLKGGAKYLINGVSSWPVGPTSTSGTFATLAEAITYVNTYGVSGNGPVNLQFASGYAGETTFIPHILNYAGSSASRVLLIDVAPGLSVTVSAPALANVSTQFSLLNMIGAKFVSVNGSSVAGQRNLTFALPTTFTTPNIHVIGLKTSESDSIADISIANCNIIGSSSTTAIYTASGIYHGGFNPTAGVISANIGNSKNITIANNYVSAVRTGIYFRGANIANGQTKNVTIARNLIGGTVPQGAGLPITYIGGVPGQAGILLKGVAGASVDSNIIRNCDSVGSLSNGFVGISLDVLSETNAIDSAISITKNTIYNLTTATGTFCAGIRVNLGASVERDLRIVNNSIAKIRGVGQQSGGSSQNPSGIILDGNSNILDISIFHNTIHLNGTSLNVNTSSACVFIGAGIRGGVRLENNILTNRLGRLGTASGAAYALYTGANTPETSPFNLLSSGVANGNTYGADAPNTINNYVVGVGTTGYPFVKPWQEFINLDFTSVGFVAFFSNDSTPVLDPRFSGLPYNGSITKLAVPTDIKGAVRPAGFTCIGALQFTQDYQPLAGNETYLINGTNNFPRTSGTAPFSFATITDAINYLNTNGVDGLSSDVRRVTLRLAAPYAGEPVDTFIPVIRQYPRQNFSRIVTLTTSPGRSDTIRTNTSQLYPNHGSVIRFLGGSYFEINGDNGSGGRGITIALPNVANPNAANLKLIDILPGDNPITNITIKNCNLIGTSGASSISTFAAIYMGGATTATPAPPVLGLNSNHVFENNFIGAVRYGIYAQGLQAGSGQQDKGIVIKRNVIGSSAMHAGNTLNWGGAVNAAAIFLSAQANTLVDSNVISNNMSSFANNRAIELASVNLPGAFSVDTGITISRNTITGISNVTAAGGAYGIYMSFADSTTPRNDRGFVIKNNMISNITAPGTTPNPATSFNNSSNPIGIYVEELYPGLRGEVHEFGLRIWNNSINLGYGTSLTATNAFSSCIAFSSQIKGGVLMQNNILQNRLGRASGTGKAATVLMGSNATIFTTSNNNIYYTNAPSATNILMACSSTVAAPLLMDSVHEVMEFTRQDTMSLNFITKFTSETNLLLSTDSAHHAFSWGTGIPSVTNDILGLPRPTFTRPTIGASEVPFGAYVDSVVPRVYDVTKAPLFCNSGAPIQVMYRAFERPSAGIRDTLYYSVNNGAVQTIVGATFVNEFTRAYNIPPQPDNSSIAYRLVLVDNSGQALKTELPASGYNYTSTSFNIFPITNGFDLPNVGGWTVDNNVNGVPSLGGWDLNTFGSPLNPVVLPQTGLKAAVFPASTLAEGSVSRLISPCLDLTNMKVPTLRMWVSQNAEDPTKNDAVQVLVGYGLLTWSAPLATVYRVNTNSVFPEFVQVDVCLSNFAGSSGYRIAIEGISKNGMNIVLDSVVIFDDVITQPISPLASTVCAYNPLVLNIPASSNTYQYTMVDTRNGLPLGAPALGNSDGSGLAITAPNPSNPAISRIDSVRAIVQYTNTLSGCTWQMPDTATITIKNFYGGPFMVQGAPFEGVFSNGTFAKPDGTKLGDTLTYEIAPPSGLTNADYGTKWTVVTPPSIATPIEGRPFADYGFTPATPSKRAYITARPSTPDLDSTFKVAVTIRFLPSGCDSTVERYLKVSSSPTASFISGSDSVCSGAAIYFENKTTAQANTYPLVYTWTFGDGTSASTGDANKIFAFDKAPGIYTVTLRATNNAGVYDEYSKQITVLPAPLTTYTNGLACGTDAISFTNTTTDAVSYLWEVALNNQLEDTSTQVNPSFSFAIADTLYSVTLRATNSLGCFRDSVRGVFAFAKPVAAFTTVDQCAGRNATFVNTSTISDGGANRVNTFGSFWDFGNGDFGLSNSPIYKYPKDSTYTVKLKVTSNYGCTDSTTRTVTIYEKPVTGFTTGIACEGDVVAITNTTTFSGGTGKVRYSWDFGDFSPISNDPNPVKTYGVTGVYTIQLVGYDTINNCYDTTSKQVEVNKMPEYVGFASVDGCVNAPIAFSNASIPAGGQTLTYAWTFGDGGTSAATNPTHPYATPGNFTVTMRATTDKGCFDDAIDTVKIENVPSALFTWDTLSLTTVWFVPEVKGLSNYKWDFGDSTKLNANDDTVQNQYQMKGAHRVTLTVTSLNGCTGSHTEDSVMTYWTIGYEEIFSSKFKLSVYPNPFEDVANITYNLESKQNVSVTVMDVLGRKVSEVVENNQSAGSHTIQLDESKFAASGVYMVRIQIGDEAVTKQLIRQ